MPLPLPPERNERRRRSCASSSRLAREQQPGEKFYSHPELEEPVFFEHKGEKLTMRGKLAESNHHRIRWPGEIRKGEHRTYLPKMKAAAFPANSEA